MNSQQRKIVRDHARGAGHLVMLWDSRDFSWYARHKMPQKKLPAARRHNASLTGGYAVPAENGRQPCGPCLDGECAVHPRPNGALRGDER